MSISPDHLHMQDNEGKSECTAQILTWLTVDRVDHTLIDNIYVRAQTDIS